MATSSQIKKIHVLKQELQIGDEAYRAALSAYQKPNGKPVESSRELSVKQASEVIEALERAVDHTPEVRNKVYASDKQVRKIFALWRRYTRAENTAGIRKTLQSFLARHFHVHDLDHLPKKKVPKIIKALEEMGKKDSSSAKILEKKISV